MNMLLHICCANCAIYPLEMLRTQGHRATGFFFNPNIHPYLEFDRRRQSLVDYAQRSDLTVIYRSDYLLEDFLAAVAPRADRRCEFCYRWRLEETAAHAAAQGFEAFTTTLLYSRYQQHDAIRRWGEELAQRYGVAFHYEDYRTGWQEGIRISKEMGLYRQQYCGCIYSEKDRYHPRPKKGQA